MQHIELYVNGETDYTKLTGSTGPLVYPAAHVYIYWALYYITDKGKDILLAQRIFGVLYLATIALVMACYRRAKVNKRPRNDHQAIDKWNSTGSSLYLPNAHPLETTSQHLCPPPIQRLFRGLLPLGSHLYLPTPTLDSWKFGIQLGIGNQDATTLGTSLDWSDPFPSQRSKIQPQAGLVDGAGTDNSSLPIHADKRNRIFQPRIRVFETILVQMDG